MDAEQTIDHPGRAEVRGGVVAYLNLSNAGNAVDFYKRALAAEEAARIPADDGKRLLHAHLYINGGSMMISDFFPEYGHAPVAVQGVTLHLQVEDADHWWNRAVAAGMTVKSPLEKQFWGDRYGVLEDPHGVNWSIGAPAD